MKSHTKKIFDEFITRYPSLRVCIEDIIRAMELLICCYKDNNKLLICGNGGSASDAQHIVGELMKGFVIPRRISNDKKTEIQRAFPKSGRYLADNLQETLPAISLLGELALTSAYANDISPEMVFAQQVFGLGREGDVLLAISTSGNSKNVIYACEVAKVQKMKIIGLTGETGKMIKDVCDITICVPSKVTYKIQEYHLPIYHVLCMALEYEFFGEE